jgi:hypothetical protein
VPLMPGRMQDSIASSPKPSATTARGGRVSWRRSRPTAGRPTSRIVGSACCSRAGISSWSREPLSTESPPSLGSAASTTGGTSPSAASRCRGWTTRRGAGSGRRSSPTTRTNTGLLRCARQRRRGAGPATSTISGRRGTATPARRHEDRGAHGACTPWMNTRFCLSGPSSHREDARLRCGSCPLSPTSRKFMSLSCLGMLRPAYSM